MAWQQPSSPRPLSTYLLGQELALCGGRQAATQAAQLMAALLCPPAPTAAGPYPAGARPGSAPGRPRSAARGVPAGDAAAQAAAAEARRRSLQAAALGAGAVRALLTEVKGV